jgi:hypothetical protein
VFGVDKVVWVEGPTEVECFQLLLASVNKRLLAGVSIVQLRATGDLEGRHSDIVADIYRNLSKTASLLPKNAVIIMDGDKRGGKKISALEKAFGLPVSFLVRRTYENYLLHPAAIVSCLNALPSFKDAPLNEATVKNAIMKIGSAKQYGASDHEVFSDKWLELVDAPNLLDDLFQNISDAREIYRKTVFSGEITRWLLTNDRNFLAPLVDEITTFIGPNAVPI